MRTKAEISLRRKAFYETNKERLSAEKKEYRLAHKDEINERHRIYRLSHKKERKEYDRIRRITHKEEIKEKKKIDYITNRNRFLVKQKEYSQTPMGKQVIAKTMNKRNRALGWNPVNSWFKGSHGHHINKEQVIYIPKDLHLSIGHSLLRNRNMDEINTAVLGYLWGVSF